MILFVFGTKKVKEILEKISLMQTKIKPRFNDPSYVEKNLEMITELRKHALSIDRPEYAKALEESMELIQKR